MAGDPSIRGLTGALETGLAGVKRGQFKLDSTERPFNLIAQTVENVLSKGTATFSWRELLSDKPLTDLDRRAFIEFKPILDFNALEPGKGATDAIRQAATELKFPDEYGARVRLTGPVPIANEEFSTVQDGAIINGIGTVLVVLVILWMALHSGKIIFAVFVNLFIGLSITTAVGLMMVGSLNLLSIAFAVLFVGLGVDFGIQFSVRYRSERFKNDDLPLALASAAERSAVPLSLAAMATAAGFLCFLPTDYKGISELGKIAGAGMLIAFLTSITVLPALLKMLNPPGESEPVGYAFLAPVDDFLEKHRVIIIVGTIVVAVAYVERGPRLERPGRDERGVGPEAVTDDGGGSSRGCGAGSRARRERRRRHRPGRGDRRGESDDPSPKNVSASRTPDLVEISSNSEEANSYR